MCHVFFSLFQSEGNTSFIMTAPVTRTVLQCLVVFLFFSSCWMSFLAFVTSNRGPAISSSMGARLRARTRGVHQGPGCLLHSNNSVDSSLEIDPRNCGRDLSLFQLSLAHSSVMLKLGQCFDNIFLYLWKKQVSLLTLIEHI